MTWSPTRRYSAVAVFSQDLERVVLIHKLRPAWQAGKANFPCLRGPDRYVELPTMSNLPWLTAMARQTLRGDGTDSTPPFGVYEAGTLS